jgi:hypothetical protein
MTRPAQDVLRTCQDVRDVPGASAPRGTQRGDLAPRGSLTNVSLVCLVASVPVACRNGA